MTFDRTTGVAIDGIDRLRQSIEDVLTTPRGSRVLRRDYGSDLPLRVGAPLNGETVVDVYADAAIALDTQIADFELARIEITAVEPGRFGFRLEADHPALDGVAGRSIDVDAKFGDAT